MSKSEEMKTAIKNLHRIYYSIDPFDSRDDFIKLHQAMEDCFNAANITSTCTEMTPKEQFQTFDLNSPPASLVEAWDKAKRGETE